MFWHNRSSSIPSDFPSRISATPMAVVYHRGQSWASRGHQWRYAVFCPSQDFENESGKRWQKPVATGEKKYGSWESLDRNKVQDASRSWNPITLPHNLFSNRRPDQGQRCAQCVWRCCPAGASWKRISPETSEPFCHICHSIEHEVTQIGGSLWFLWSSMVLWKSRLPCVQSNLLQTKQLSNN